MYEKENIDKYFRETLISYKIESAKRNKEACFQSNSVDNQVHNIIENITATKSIVMNENMKVTDVPPVEEVLSFPRRVYRKYKKYRIVRGSWELVKKIRGKIRG